MIVGPVGGEVRRLVWPSALCASKALAASSVAGHGGGGGRFDAGTYAVAISAEVVEPLAGASVNHPASVGSEPVMVCRVVPSPRASRPLQVEQLVLLESE
ncbi:MAG: hypothetical protein ACR2HQ_05580 [Ilumatobacteraceae bacterium]